jgi:hypothetical protein
MGENVDIDKQENGAECDTEEQHVRLLIHSVRAESASGRNWRNNASASAINV